VPAVCGRIVLKAPAHQVAAEFALPDEPELTARYNITPGQAIAVVRGGPDGRRACRPLRWGLIPPWATDPREGDRLINARGETAAVKPAFREALAARRCLIPADGFYEWQRRTTPRQPWYFSAPDGHLLALAGLWSRWTDAGGRSHESCAILTTEAAAPVAAVHHRMPVLVAPEDRDRWLLAPADRLAELQALLAPAPAAALQGWPVATLVNRATAEGPELCEPLRHEPPRQLDLF
jgi:putative SOS response-associated peptidase YedK